jgi:hypothetical protein
MFPQNLTLQRIIHAEHHLLIVVVGRRACANFAVIILLLVHCLPVPSLYSKIYRLVFHFCEKQNHAEQSNSRLSFHRSLKKAQESAMTTQPKEASSLTPLSQVFKS